jgi:predicted O-methyltransferase YrrM
MSLATTMVTEEIDEYLLHNFSADDDFLKGIREDAVANGFPPIFISPVQGKFMQVMLASINARYVLEIGSLAGYSAILLARALPADGKLITIEKDQARAEYAQQQVNNSGLSDIITVINADAHEFLIDYNPGYKFDFFFADADKEGYIDYLDKSHRLVRKGGIVAFDNALAFGEIADRNPDRDIEVMAVREFNQYFKKHQSYLSCLVTTGDGIAMAVKLD